MNPLVLRGSRDTIAHHAKSFFWASQFLPKGCFRDTSVLYTFCRWVDDSADETAPEEGEVQLTRIEDQLSGQRDPVPLMEEFLAMSERRNMDLEYARQLILGARSDLVEVRVQDDKELLIYCYRVAGTVGLMMCPLLGVHKKAAQSFAVDLGVAMQLTNICRDVLEDAQNGRVYLPESRLRQVGLSSEDLVQNRAGSVQVAQVVRELLEMADSYYQSAFDGLRYIPFRTRMAILVAAHIYRAIGLKLKTWQYNALRGRAMVSPAKKLWYTFLCVFGFFRPRYWSLRKEPHHQAELHKELKGLPGI